MILYYAAFSVFMLSFCLGNVYFFFFNKPEFETMCIDAEIQFLLLFTCTTGMFKIFQYLLWNCRIIFISNHLLMEYASFF